METYTQIKQRHSDEFGEFPIAFAFSEKQLQEALVKLGAKQCDCVSLGSGGIIQKTEQGNFAKLVDRHSSEMAQFYKDDKSLVSAIVYELGNHEYGYTWDESETISALDLDMEDERTKTIFQEAKEQYLTANADNF